MEDCTALNRRVHEFIKAGALAFDDEDVPNVNKHPLPDHQRSKVNVVDSDPELQIEKDVKAGCMLVETVYEALLKAGMLEEEQEKKTFQRMIRELKLMLKEQKKYSAALREEYHRQTSGQG